MLVYKDDFVQRSVVPTIREEGDDDHPPQDEEDEDEHRDEIFSIIGHLERDEQKLFEKLRDSPDLAEPIIEAQAQLNRLKDLMFNIFGRRPAATEIAEQQLQQQQQQQQKQQQQQQQQQLQQQKQQDGDGQSTGLGAGRGVFGMTSLADYRSSARMERRPVLRLDDTQPLPPSESTRLDGIMAENGGGADRRYATQPANFILGQHVFSPIAHLEPTGSRGAGGRLEESSEESLLRGDGEGAEEGVSYERSLTRFSLGDLSRRLGGTGLCYSRDSLLEITERLQQQGQQQGEQRGEQQGLHQGQQQGEQQGDSQLNTAEELEKLMLSLSGNNTELFFKQKVLFLFQFVARKKFSFSVFTTVYAYI
jgi:hypothetical protein